MGLCKNHDVDLNVWFQFEGNLSFVNNDVGRSHNLGTMYDFEIVIPFLTFFYYKVHRLVIDWTINFITQQPPWSSYVWCGTINKWHHNWARSFLLPTLFIYLFIYFLFVSFYSQLEIITFCYMLDKQTLVFSFMFPHRKKDWKRIG